MWCCRVALSGAVKQMPQARQLSSEDRQAALSSPRMGPALAHRLAPAAPLFLLEALCPVIQPRPPNSMLGRVSGPEPAPEGASPPGKSHARCLKTG